MIQIKCKVIDQIGASLYEKSTPRSKNHYETCNDNVPLHILSTMLKTDHLFIPLARSVK